MNPHLHDDGDTIIGQHPCSKRRTTVCLPFIPTPCVRTIKQVRIYRDEPSMYGKKGNGWRSTISGRMVH